MSGGDATLRLQLCPSCAGEEPDRAGCLACDGSGVLDAYGHPFHPPAPFVGWSPLHLVNLSRHSSGEPLLAEPAPSTSTDWRDAVARNRQRLAEAPPPRPHRMTLSEVLSLVLTRSPSDHSTVRLARNAKGETQVDVSIRTGEPGLETVDAAAAKARELYDQLTAAYPMAESE